MEINGTDYLCISALSDPQSPIQSISANISVVGSPLTPTSIVINGSRECINARELLNLYSTSTCAVVLINATAKNENGITSASHYVAWNNSRLEGNCYLTQCTHNKNNIFHS